MNPVNENTRFYLAQSWHELCMRRNGAVERGSSLRNAYIKFQTPEDRALGCNTLMAHSYISRLSGDIFCIPWHSLELLEIRQVPYSFATEDDLSNAHQIWNFAAPAF